MESSNLLIILFQKLNSAAPLITALAAVMAAWFALEIGTRQNQISELQDYAEVFVMPDLRNVTDTHGNQHKVTVLLIKNASSYPIYLNSYVMNGIKKDVGSSAIPNNSDSWFGAPLPNSAEQDGNLSLVVFFEDYKGNKYSTEVFGKYSGGGWEIISKKRVVLKD